MKSNQTYLFILLFVLLGTTSCSRMGCKSRPSDDPENQLVSKTVAVNDPFRIGPGPSGKPADPLNTPKEQVAPTPPPPKVDVAPPPVVEKDVVSSPQEDLPAIKDSPNPVQDVQVAATDPGQVVAKDMNPMNLNEIPEHAKELVGIDIIVPDDIAQVSNETLRDECQSGKEQACKFLHKRLQKGCLWEDQDSCATLGYMLQTGLGVQANPEKALTYLEKSCSDGHPSGCTWLAGAYLDGKGILINELKAAELYEKGCDLGSHMACNNLGFLHREGRGVALDDTRAFELFDQSCKGGELRGCLNLARSYEKGLGVEKDEPKANELYLIACDSSLYFACYYMGLKYEKGVSVEQDAIKATSLFRVACDNGIQKACGHL